MQILNSLEPLSTLALTGNRTAVQGWRVGQVLQAMVLAPASNGKASLQIGGQAVEAESQLPLRSGEALTVRVEQQGSQPLLRVLHRAAPALEIQARALRSDLPRQAPLPPLLANLQVLAHAPPKAAEGLPQALLQLARSVLQSLPEVGSVSHADGLRRALLSSGTFLESRLAASLVGREAPPIRDLKATLLRLVAHLTSQSASGEKPLMLPPPSLPPMRSGPPAPQAPSPATLSVSWPVEQATGELRTQAEGGVARIQIHQLNSLPGDDATRPALFMEVPVRHAQGTDVWSVRIEQEQRSRTGDAQAAWSVSLAFDLEGLGPVYARVRLQADRVSTTFWAEDPDTALHLQAHRAELREQMDAVGLNVADIQVHAGGPPQGSGEALTPSLVNVEA